MTLDFYLYIFFWRESMQSRSLFNDKCPRQHWTLWWDDHLIDRFIICDSTKQPIIAVNFGTHCNYFSKQDMSLFLAGNGLHLQLHSQTIIHMSQWWATWFFSIHVIHGINNQTNHEAKTTLLMRNIHFGKFKKTHSSSHNFGVLFSNIVAMYFGKSQFRSFV